MYGNDDTLIMKLKAVVHKSAMSVGCVCGTYELPPLFVKPESMIQREHCILEKVG